MSANGGPIREPSSEAGPAPEYAERQDAPRRLPLPRFSTRGTYALIALNGLVFVVDWLSGGTVATFGALVPALVVAYRQLWRLILSGFLHADVLHILLNLYAVYGLGSLLERFFGLKRMLIIYALSLLGCGVLVTLFSSWRTPTVGASGAIMGVLGALVVYFWKYRDLLVGGRGYLGELGRLALINIGIGLLPGISWWGHLGGFLAGVAAGLALVPRYARPDWTATRLELRSLSARSWLAAGLVLVVEGLLLALAFWLRG